MRRNLTCSRTVLEQNVCVRRDAQDSTDCEGCALTADDPFDPANLEGVSGVERDIMSVGPHTECAMLVAPGGQVFVAPFHGHDELIMDAMRIGGYADGPDDEEYLSEYCARSGVLCVQLWHGGLTASGLLELTGGQKKSLRDVCLFAHITDPDSIVVDDIDNVSPRELCAGVSA